MLSFSPILRSKANPQYINPSMELGIVPVIEKDTTDFEHLIKKLIPIIAAISNFTHFLENGELFHSSITVYYASPLSSYTWVPVQDTTVLLGTISIFTDFHHSRS